MIKAGQMKAARALLGWSQKDLADKSGVSSPTIKRMEAIGPERSSAAVVEAVERALISGGITFIPENGGGAGARLAKPSSDHEPRSSHADIAQAFNLGKESYFSDIDHGLDANPYTPGTDLHDAYVQGFWAGSKNGRGS